MVIKSQADGVLDMCALTQQRLKELLAYDEATGVFTRKTKHHRFDIGSIAGGVIPSGYRIMRIEKKNQYAHRLAWLYVHGEFPAKDIDHIDGNRDNNAIANLRAATRSQNLQNQRKPRSDNKSGILGVSYSKGRNKWVAQIVHGGKQRNLGHYASPELAKEAYITAKRQFHAFCTL